MLDAVETDADNPGGTDDSRASSAKNLSAEEQTEASADAAEQLDTSADSTRHHTPPVGHSTHADTEGYSCITPLSRAHAGTRPCSMDTCNPKERNAQNYPATQRRSFLRHVPSSFSDLGP